MAESAVDSNEDLSEETEDLEPLEQDDGGTFQQVTNLLNIIDSESKMDAAGAGPDMRKTLASVIITEKATAKPCMVMNALIRCLQVPEISTQRKVNIYNILQEIIQQEGELEEQCVHRLVTIASKEMREILEVEGYMKAEVASDTLVALSRNHFSVVMYEMQHRLKPLDLTDEFVIITLAKLANGNVFEFMPYMGITLATIFTMLRLVNEAKMRQVICGAMETFCETVQFYLRHLEDSVYPVMTEEQFAIKLFPMYRYFVTVWLRSYNPEVKLGVIKSLRPMLNLLLPNDDLREEVYDYLPLLLAEYQGSLEALFITQVLRQILEVSVITSTPVPQMHLHTIFTELHIQVCTKAPVQQQYSSQNVREIEHCFIALARSYPKELMKFFLSQMEISKEAIRVGTLTLIRAVVGADDPRMNIKTICLAIRVVKNTVSDTRSKVRMAILRIIGQLALSGFQDRIKGWGLKYVSIQLTLSTYKLTNRRESFHQRDLEEKMVHKVTMDTVKIITSAVSGMTNEFWVRLLCYIMETNNMEVLTPICISLTNLAERQFHIVDGEASVASKSRHVDLPAPQKLLARLLVLMSSPYEGEGRGIAMLNLLRTLSHSIAPSMADMWELEIPLLIKYLEEHTKFTWNQETWADKLIQFLRLSLKKTRGSNWSLRLAKELNNQIESFDSPSLEKSFLYRALGFTLATGLEADKVEVLLLELLYKTDYSKDFDREGVILCFGLCAQGQVKTVLSVLQDFEERIQESEESWQIGAWRKDHPWRRETVKSALMVMYSCVALHCHWQMLLTHVDTPITAKIIHHYTSSSQDICLKMAFMKSVVQISNAIENLKGPGDFQFAQKMTLTAIIVAIIKAEPTDHLVSPMRTMAMDALLHLSKVKPFYSTEENSELMDISIHSVISLQPPGKDNESIKTLYTNALCVLQQLMEGLLQRQMDPKGLQEMVHLLEKWILSEKEWEREKAMNLHLCLMQSYIQSIGVCIPLKLGQFGTLIGLIAPCTCDSNKRIRLASADVLSSLLDLHASQTCSSWDACKELELVRCKQDLQGLEVEKIFSASSRIAKMICMQFNCDEVVSLIQKLCENIGAMDLQHDKASVTWIDIFLQMRVKELEDKVAEILGAILVHLPVVDHQEVRRHLIEGILLLAHYHQETVLTSLLRQPLPMQSHLVEVWLAVAENVPFARLMLHGLMGRLQSRFTPRANATSKADIWRLAAVDPLMTLCTIHLLIEKMDKDDKLPDLLPDLIYTLLMQLGSSQGPEAVSPALKTWRLIHTGTLPEEINLQRITIKSMQLLFKRLDSGQLVHMLEEQGVWALLESGSTFLQGAGLLARLCIRNAEGYRQRLSELVLRGMASEVLSCRVSSTAICVEFMSDPILYQERLLKPAMQLLEKGVDQREEVLQVLSLRALGNMALGAPKKVRQYRKLLLEKCLYALRDARSTSVPSEGMEALAKILAELREGDVGSFFNAISEQCRSFFDNESELLRLKAFLLFSKLAKVVRVSKKHFFKGEVKRAWVPLMLHCQDPCPDAAQPEKEMAESAVDSNEDLSEETEDLEPLEQDDGGTFQQVTNLLNIIDSESKMDAAGAGPDMRKTLASVIITEKATAKPCMVMNALIRCLQVPEISTQRKVNIYNILQEIIQQEGELEEQCVHRLVTIASKEMREILEVEGYMKAEVASDTLVALSRNHFSVVMYEMQHRLKPLDLTDEFVIITLAKLANGNVFEFMPYMGITLATIFTMLRLVNEAKMRQVICGAMETFCETVQFYLRHLEDSVYPVMTEEQFAIKLFPMYRYFVTVWLRSYNPEVKLGVIKSLRPMLNLLLPNDDLREEVYDYLPLLLAEYQGSLEALFITQVLRQILEVSVITSTPVPQMHLHTIFTELHIQVCTKAPVQQQYSSQNVREIEHCFIALARSYPKELMKFFLSQMEISKEAIRVGTLTLIRAVVGADDPRMNIKTICLAIRVVKNTVSDTRSKVRMAILRIIGQLALSGFQDRIKGWGLKYVSIQLTLSTYKLTNRRESFHQRDLEEKMVHKVTMDTVKIITSAVSGMTNEFWVRLLCYIMETNNMEVLTPICISLTNLAERQFHIVDGEASVASKSRHVDLPAPQKLLARLLVLMSSPYEGEGRGIAMLNLLRTLSHSIAPSMADMWELEIPLLIKYLEEHTKFTWNQETWADKLIQFLRLSLKKTRGSNWSLRLAKELNNQIESFDSPSLEKSFLYRALGFTLATGLEADKVEVLLLELLYKTDYSKDFDREGVILCFGLCAQGQVKTVLSVLQDFEERIQESEESWQIGAWRKDHPWRRETVKSALMVMYSCVALHCHWQMLLTHVDTPITAKIIHHYTSSSQDICLKMAFMKSVVQISNAIENLKGPGDFQFAQKMTLTAIIVAIIKAEPTDNLVSPMRTMAMDALLHLSKVKPFYSTEENSELMDISIHSVISLQPPGKDNESIKTLYTNALCILQQLMEGLLQRQMDPKGLQEMVHLLEKWILSEKEWEREKAMNLHLCLMQSYIQSIGVCIPLKLGQFGTLIGLIAPCTCDSNKRIRLASADVLSSLLDLHASQTCSSWDACKELELVRCKQDLQGLEVEKIFSASSRIAKMICMQFNCDEVVSLIQKLCENIGAMDLQHDKASVTWIDIFLQMRVKELEDKVAEILGAILVHLPVVDHQEVRRHLIEGILLLAHYHQETVLTSLLRQPLPMQSHLVEVWLAVAENVPFARLMLHGLMGRLQSRFTPRANATSKADIWRLAAVDPLMTLCTIHLLIEKMDKDDKLPDLLPDLIYTLLMQLGSSQGPEAVSPALKTWRLIHTGTLPEEINLQRITIKSMQLLFKRLDSGQLVHMLEEQGVWALLESGSTFLQGAGLLARLCIRNAEGYRQRLSELVLRGMASEVLSCRVSSTAICVEFMSDPILYQERLLKPAMQLLEKGVDQREEVLQVLSLRALGNMALGAPKKVRQYRKLLLEKCLYALRDARSTSVPSEGMEALAKILAELREGDVGSFFNAISEQCRSFFDNESELLRLKAFLLFSKLAKVVRVSKKHFFKGEVKRAWVPLMLHCQDPCPDAAQACVETVYQCVHFWGCKGLVDSSGQRDTRGADEMATFQTTLCSVLTQKKPAVLYSFLLETMPYIKSNLSRIRIASCNLAGVIMKQMSEHYLKKLDFVALRNSLQELQLDTDPGVQRAALETLKILDTCSQHRLLASPKGNS